jgi:hypothetical protein
VDKDITNDIDTNSLKDNDTTSFTVWVDKKTKLINKLAVDTADQKDQNGASGSLTLTMSYGPVSIEKPAGSKPFAEVLSELTGLFQENPFLQNSLGQF